jgi:pyruvate dehydrogenase E2 component (dihydrolipoamide acetyltransferase)
VITVGTVHKAPVVEGDKVVIGNVMQVNFLVDHRYVDGGRCKQLFPALKKVFDEP